MKLKYLLFLFLLPTPYPFGFGLVDILSIFVGFKLLNNFLKSFKIYSTELILISFIISPLIFNFTNTLGYEIINGEVRYNIIGYLGLCRSLLPFFFAKFFNFDNSIVKRFLKYYLIVNLLLGFSQKFIGGNISELIRNIWFDNFGREASLNVASGTFGNYAYYAAGISILIGLVFNKNYLQRLSAILISSLNFFVAPILTYPISFILTNLFSNLRFINLENINKKSLRLSFINLSLLTFLVIFLFYFGPNKIKELINLIFFNQELKDISGTVGASFLYRINVSFIDNINYFISQPFFGVGFSKAADSFWLGLLATQGLIGFLLFIFIFISIYSKRRRLHISQKSNLELNYFNFLLPSIFFSSFTQFPITGGLSAQLFWFITGIIFYQKLPIKKALEVKK